MMPSHCRSLYSGLSAGLQRQMCFASVRIGLYDTFKAIYQQLLDGTLTGSVSASNRSFATTLIQIFAVNVTIAFSFYFNFKIHLI